MAEEEKTTTEETKTEQTTTGTSTENKSEEIKDDGANPSGQVKEEKEEEDTTEIEEYETFPEDKKAIEKQVKKQVAPYLDTIHKQTVESELKSIFAENPEYKSYEARIRRFVEHPNRSKMIKDGLPVSTVVTEALQPYFPQIITKKREAADKKAREETVNASSVATKEAKVEDYSKMSSTDIAKIASQVKSGRYQPQK